MASRVLHVLSVDDRQWIGTIELTEDGGLRMAPRGVQGLVDRMMKTRGWNSREAFRNLAGWSNGYLQIVPALSLAKVFDGLEPGTDEPRFADDHPIVADPDRRRRLSDYLKAGRPILSTTARHIDRVDRTRGQVVPLSFRTDGAWIWTDTVTYYLDTYGLQPDNELTSHIAARGYRCPNVDDVTARRAFDVLRSSSPDPDNAQALNDPPADT